MDDAALMMGFWEAPLVDPTFFLLVADGALVVVVVVLVG
jgi:hypothetical protein